MDEFDEPDEPNPDEETVDELLDQERPDRYDTDDQEWMEPVVRKVRDQLLEESAEKIAEEYARRLVHTREGVATVNLNKLLRRFKDGEFPFGFGEGEDWKTFYATYLRAPLMIGKYKVRFGAAGAADLDEWVAEKRRAGEREQTRRAEAIDGAEHIAAALRQQRADRTEDFHRAADR
jgi:hypothetical protein